MTVSRVTSTLTRCFRSAGVGKGFEIHGKFWLSCTVAESLKRVVFVGVLAFACGRILIGIGRFCGATGVFVTRSATVFPERVHDFTGCGGEKARVFRACRDFESAECTYMLYTKM